MLRRRLNDLIQQRAAQLNAAETALAAENHADYDSAMTQVNNMNTEIQRIQNLIAEQDRKMLGAPAPTGSEAEDMAAERGTALLRGDAINFTSLEIRRALSNQITLGSGQLAEPVGTGTTIHDGHNGVVSSIVDQVNVQDFTGYSGWQEPYVKEDAVANAGKIDTLSGTARAAVDPTYRVAAIKPYEVNVTTFIDRNTNRVNPARYYEKAQQIAMRALRRKVADLIVNGDGQLVYIYPVSPADDKVTAFRGKIQPVLALHQVTQRPNLFRDPYPPGGQPILWGRGKITAGAGIDIGAVGQVGGVDAVELAAGAVAGVQQTFVHHFFEIAVINIASLALGSSFPVPVQTQPPQIVPEDVGKVSAGALGVQILHAQDQGAVTAAHRQPGDQGGKYVAQVHPPGGRGSKSSDYLFHGVHLIKDMTHRASTAAMARVSRTMVRIRIPFPLGLGLGGSGAGSVGQASSGTARVILVLAGT